MPAAFAITKRKSPKGSFLNRPCARHSRKAIPRSANKPPIGQKPYPGAGVLTILPYWCGERSSRFAKPQVRKVQHLAEPQKNGFQRRSRPQNYPRTGVLTKRGPFSGSGLPQTRVLTIPGGRNGHRPEVLLFPTSAMANETPFRSVRRAAPEKGKSPEGLFPGIDMSGRPHAVPTPGRLVSGSRPPVAGLHPQPRPPGHQAVGPTAWATWPSRLPLGRRAGRHPSWGAEHRTSRASGFQARSSRR